MSDDCRKEFDLKLDSDAVEAARGYLGEADADYLLEELSEIVNVRMKAQAPVSVLSRKELGIAWLKGWMSKQRISDKTEAGLDAIMELLAAIEPGKRIVENPILTAQASVSQDIEWWYGLVTKNALSMLGPHDLAERLRSLLTQTQGEVKPDPKCPDCDGTGLDWEEMNGAPCPTCCKPDPADSAKVREAVATYLTECDIIMDVEFLGHKRLITRKIPRPSVSAMVDGLMKRLAALGEGGRS